MSFILFDGFIMHTRILALLMSLLLSSPLWAFKCYFTLAKENCWLKYNVSVDVLDAATGKVVTTIVVPEGKVWTRQTFSCDLGQKLSYKASFTPLIWESERGRVYASDSNWSLPLETKPGDKAWNISVCYSKDFAEVPMPPQSTGDCSCDMQSIPEPPPE